MYTGHLSAFIEAFAKIQDENFGFENIQDFITSEGKNLHPEEKSKQIKF